MVLDNHTITALEARGLEDKEKAQEYYDALTDDDKAAVTISAGDNRVTENLLGRLLGTDEQPGGLREMMTTTLSKHTTDIDERINKIVHNRLDKNGVLPTPGTGKPKPKPAGGKSDEEVIPDGMVPASKVDELREEINQRDIKQSITTALNMQELMPGALDMAIGELAGNAEKDVAGNVVIKMKDGDGLLRAMSPADAVSALRGQKKFLFKASVKGGSGGGGVEDGAGGSEDKPTLPKVSDYGELLKNAALLNRYINEAPEELKKLETAYAGASEGELARIMSGQGIDPRSQVDAALANMKANAKIQ